MQTIQAPKHQQSKKKLELIHSDVCRPLKIELISGNQYLVTFIDDYSECVSVYLVKHKTKVFKMFEAIITKECRMDNSNSKQH